MKKQRIIGIVLLVVGALSFLGSSPYLSAQRYADGISAPEIAAMALSFACMIAGGILIYLSVRKKK